jgi:TadE-like protein
MDQQTRNSERGSVTTEFVFVTPLLVLAMLILLGLGYTVMTKQNAIVGARAAVYYRAPRDQMPPPDTVTATIKDAVSPGREQWALEFNEGSMDDPQTGSVSFFQSVVNRIYQSFNKDIRYTAHGTATLGFLPRIMDLGRAQGVYSLPRGTWTCAQTGGGSYTSITLGALGLPAPFNRWLDLSCCEIYDASFR